MQASLMLSQIYRELGNGSAASYYMFVATKMHPRLAPGGIPEIEHLQKENVSAELYKIRSPDLNLINNWSLSDQELQTRGIWNKIDAKSSLGPKKRESPLCWIWRSRLYIFGGMLIVKDKKTKKVINQMTDIW